MRNIVKWFLEMFSSDKNYLGVMYEATEKVLHPDILGPIIELFIPVGIMMAMVHISKEFFEKASLKNIDLEQILKLFMKLIVASALVMNSTSLIYGMNEFSNSFYNGMRVAILIDEGKLSDTGETLFKDEIFNKFDTNYIVNEEEAKKQDEASGNAIDMLTGTGVILMTLLGSFFYQITIFIQSYSRAMNIGYKTIYAPIAFSNITGNSTRNGAITFAKELFALFMQLPVAYLGMAITYKLLMDFKVTGFLIPVVYIIGARWVSKSGSISKELFT